MRMCAGTARPAGAGCGALAMPHRKVSRSFTAFPRVDVDYSVPPAKELPLIDHDQAMKSREYREFHAEMKAAFQEQER